MLQYAVFVDAGYLLTAGGWLLGGKELGRETLHLDCDKVIKTLEQEGKKIAPHSRLLRIYWYDALLHGRKSEEHKKIGDLDNVKLRFGYLNSQGKQKGVDSLIITDMIELARQHAIADAILLAGDNDFTVGVNITQSFGTRVHLIGVDSIEGNQSNRLLEEVDTKQVWESNTIRGFLSIIDRGWDIEKTVKAFISTLDAQKKSNIRKALQSTADIPYDIYKQLLFRCKKGKGVFLSSSEQKAMRKIFIANLG